jgi:hypothetical protein
LNLEEVVSRIIILVLFIGLASVGIGAFLWIFERFQESSISWQLQLVILGVVLLFFGGIALKLFSRD